jgi:hypothetical protein
MDHADEIMARGEGRGTRNLGVHLIRKGAATFCLNGTTDFGSEHHGHLYSGGMYTRKRSGSLQSVCNCRRSSVWSYVSRTGCLFA